MREIIPLSIHITLETCGDCFFKGLQEFWLCDIYNNNYLMSFIHVKRTPAFPFIQYLYKKKKSGNCVVHTNKQSRGIVR